MKTSELIKKINDLGNCVSVEMVDGIASAFTDNKQTLICQVDDDIISTFKDRFAINSPISNAIELMFEYATTPREEREEEKKYYLLFPKGYRVEKVYLGRCDDISVSNFGDYLNTTILDGFYKVKFTQKEIDTMPFDTNFFIKEEVK